MTKQTVQPVSERPLKDWEDVFENQLIPLLNAAKNAEDLRVIGREVIARLYQKGNDLEQAVVAQKQATLDKICDIPTPPGHETTVLAAQREQIIQWLRRIKDERIALQRVWLEAGGDAQVVAGATNEEILPNVEAKDNKDALAYTVEIAVREMLATEMRHQFKASMEECFPIPRHALAERFQGVPLPWVFAAAEFDKVLDQLLPQILRIKGTRLEKIIGDICTVMTKQAEHKKLHGYAKTALPKDRVQVERVAQARRKIVDDVKSALHSAFAQYISEKPDRQPLALFITALKSYNSVPQRSKDKTYVDNLALREKAQEKLEKAQLSPDLNFDVAGFTFEDLAVVAEYVSESQSRNGFSSIRRKLTSHLHALREKFGDGHVMDAKDFELIYKELDSFALDGRMVISEAYAWMLFVVEPEFNLQKLQQFRAFKSAGAGPKPLLGRYIFHYVECVGRQTGALLNRADVGIITPAERQTLMRSLVSCFEAVARPPTKTEAGMGVSRAAGGDAPTRKGAGQKLIDELKAECGATRLGSIASIAIAGLEALNAQYAHRKNAEDTSERHDPLADFALANEMQALRTRLATFERVFRGEPDYRGAETDADKARIKAEAEANRVKYNSVFDGKVAENWETLYALCDIMELRMHEKIPAEATSMLTRVLNDTGSMAVRNEFQLILQALSTLCQRANLTKLAPDAHMENIIADYMQWLTTRILPQSETPAQ